MSGSRVLHLRCLLLSSLFLLTSCGGGGGGASGTAPPAQQKAKVSSAVVVVPADSVQKYSFDPATARITSTDTTTTLAPGSVVQIGEQIVKISEALPQSDTTVYNWEHPTIDEAYDEIDIAVSTLEAAVPVTGEKGMLAENFNCPRPTLVTSESGSGLRFSCTAPVAAGSSLSLLGTILVKFEDVKIKKAGKGIPTTTAWKMTTQVTPEVGFRWTAKDVVGGGSGLPELLKKVPECAAAGLSNISGSLSAGAARRVHIATIPLASQGLLSLAVPTCFLFDMSDSKIGLDILGKAKWKFQMVKDENAALPTLASNDFSALLDKAIPASAAGLSAQAAMKTRLEFVPMIQIGLNPLKSFPLFGILVNPGLDVKLTAKATPLKQGVCATVSFASDLGYWVTGLISSVQPVEKVLISDKPLIGDACDPGPDPNGGRLEITQLRCTVSDRTSTVFVGGEFRQRTDDFYVITASGFVKVPSIKAAEVGSLVFWSYPVSATVTSAVSEGDGFFEAASGVRLSPPTLVSETPLPEIKIPWSYSWDSSQAGRITGGYHVKPSSMWLELSFVGGDIPLETVPVVCSKQSGV